jgi:signal transduction histidine kinase
MGFNRLGASLALYNAPQIAGESTAKLDARGQARLAERKRIARELHDTVLQGFFAVSLQLHAAFDHLPADSALKPRFSGVLQTLDRVLEEGRRAVQGLRSPHRESQCLGQALAGVPNLLGIPSTVGFRVLVEGQPRQLRAGLNEEIYRIGQEAIVNAYRHSRAEHIEADVEFRSTGLRIIVRDDGCGIDPQALQRTGHWGLLGMRERAERMGARLRVWSKAALGTEIELCVPSRIAFEQSAVAASESV